MNKKTIKQIDISGKRVLLRVDFNVPMEGEKITDDSRIRAALPTLNYLLAQNCAIVVCSHLGRPKGKVNPEYSLAPVARRLEELLGKPVNMAPAAFGQEAVNAAANTKPGEILMLENVRFHPGEEKNDDAYARELASMADVFCNDAFGAAHRAHSSTAGVAKHLPAVAGLLMEAEINALSSLLDQPKRPFVAVIGGAKVADKIAVLESLVARVDSLLIGGGMGNTFRAAKGLETEIDPPEPAVLDEARRIVALAEQRGIKLLLPVDLVVADAFKADASVKVTEGPIPKGWLGLDIGPETRKMFSEEIRGAKTVFWNGPVGVFEMAPFRAGTDAVAAAVAECHGMTVVGGGDSLSAIEQAGVGSRIKHLSTGGGASLEFMEGKELPGVRALLDR